MRIFVAGGTGVVGRRVVLQLTGQGHDVRAVARSPEKAGWLQRAGATPVRVDLFDPEEVAKAVAGQDVVVNLATNIPPMMRMLQRSAWRTNDRLRSEAARNLVDGAIESGAGRFVQESFAPAYPDRGGSWISEDTALEPVSYAATILDAEAQTRRFSDSGGPGVVVRFGLFYAPDSGQTQIMIRFARRGILALPGSGETYQSWIHADDAATAVVAALDVPAGAYNAVESAPMTSGEHTALLGRLLGRRVWQPPLPRIGPLEMATRSQRVSNQRLRDASGWDPVYPGRSEGWAAVLRAIR